MECLVCGIPRDMMFDHATLADTRACVCGYAERESPSAAPAPTLAGLVRQFEDGAHLRAAALVRRVSETEPVAVMGAREGGLLAALGAASVAAASERDTTLRGFGRSRGLAVGDSLPGRHQHVLVRPHDWSRDELQEAAGRLEGPGGTLHVLHSASGAARHLFGRECLVRHVEQTCPDLCLAGVQHDGELTHAWFRRRERAGGHAGSRDRMLFTANSTSVVRHYQRAVFSRGPVMDSDTVYLLCSGPTINLWPGPRSDADLVVGCKGVVKHARWGGRMNAYFCGDGVLNRTREREGVPLHLLSPTCDVYVASTERGRWVVEHGVSDRNLRSLVAALYPRQVYPMDVTHDPYYPLHASGAGQAVVGHNTGLMMFQTAVLLGARNIVLVGADCTGVAGRDANVHFDDARGSGDDPVRDDPVRDDYLHHWRRLAEWLRADFPHVRVHEPRGLRGMWPAWVPPPGATGLSAGPSGT